MSEHRRVPTQVIMSQGHSSLMLRDWSSEQLFIIIPNAEDVP